MRGTFESGAQSLLGGCPCSHQVGRRWQGERSGGDSWAAIAAGTASEDAAVGAGVPQAVGSRWFRKAGGMPPSMFGLSAKPLSGRYLSFPKQRPEIAAPSRSGLTIDARDGRYVPPRAGAIDNLRRAAAHVRHPKPRGHRVSCDDSAVARRAQLLVAPPAGDARAQRGVKNLCRGTVGWRRRGSAAARSAAPGPVVCLDHKLGGTRPRTCLARAMGERLGSPQHDRPSPAGGTSRTTRPCASALKPSIRALFDGFKVDARCRRELDGLPAATGRSCCGLPRRLRIAGRGEVRYLSELMIQANVRPEAADRAVPEPLAKAANRYST